ncbi:hypothetical protein OIU84_022559 [Salix udensis]|uniref:Uncharacterized protein n=1 Tax=Salix udensis TaxID=889485 RepID=A0AAD6KR67_9ROSI|nr:hypothetical protein OIU84_022559 [Salix udensis]
MAGSFTRGENSHQGRLEAWRSSQLPEIGSTTTQVVLVMDGLEEFTIKPLKWALENISACGGINVTLPWLNILCQRCITLGLTFLVCKDVPRYNPGLNVKICAVVLRNRHQRRDMEFIADKFPCNLVMINENGEPVTIKMRPPTTREFTSGESPHLLYLLRYNFSLSAGSS